MPFRNIFAELRTGLRRNFSMTVSLVVTMSVSLMLASLGLLIQSQADRTEQYFGDRLQLQVNMCTQNSPGSNCLGGRASEEQRSAVEDALQSNPEVESYSTKTPKENYKQAKQFLGQTETGRKQLKALGPDSFQV